MKGIICVEHIEENVIETSKITGQNISNLLNHTRLRNTYFLRVLIFYDVDDDDDGGGGGGENYDNSWY
jgi:hypothetical protein